MKRIFIFALLGPPLGMAAGMLVLLPAISFIAGEPIVFDRGQIVGFATLLPAAYMLGLLPALLVGFVDGLLAGKNIRWRMAWTASVGFFAGFLPLITSLLAGFIHGPFVLLVGFVGAVPAAACSWLAGRMMQSGVKSVT
jgi:hypothetical protein